MSTEVQDAGSLLDLLAGQHRTLSALLEENSVLREVVQRQDRQLVELEGTLQGLQEVALAAQVAKPQGGTPRTRPGTRGGPMRLVRDEAPQDPGAPGDDEGSSE